MKRCIHVSPLVFLLTSGVLLSGCANMLNILDDVQLGQNAVQAEESVRSPKSWVIENEKIKYIIWGYIATFSDMYDNTITYYFVKLEDGKVVDKGMVRRRQRSEIKIVDPSFDTEQLKRRPRPIEETP
jgi:hypothetical protein